MKIVIPALLLMALSTPCLAEESLNLYPKGREAYQAKFDSAEERYEIDKRSYVDNLYEYKGEGSAPASTREKMVPEAELDAEIEKLNHPSGSQPEAAEPPIPSR